MKQNCFQHWW